MKVIALEHCGGHTPQCAPRMTLLPDSALVLNGNPVFLPEFSDEWFVRIYLAFRICRLGKGIGAKFASRYRDGVTLAARIIPADIRRDFAAETGADGLLGAFDNALTLGAWQAIPSDGVLRVEVGSAQPVEFSPESCGIDSAIPMLSNYMTLKMGDVVMPVSVPLEIPVKVGDRLELKLNSVDVGAVRFK